jgi:hypothetical protein
MNTLSNPTLANNQKLLDSLKRPTKKDHGVIDLSKYEGKVRTKSDLIRAMHADGYEVGTIASALGIVYQHARNVIRQTPKKAPVTLASPTETGPQLVKTNAPEQEPVEEPKDVE